MSKRLLLAVVRVLQGVADGVIDPENAATCIENSLIGTETPMSSEVAPLLYKPVRELTEFTIRASKIITRLGVKTVFDLTALSALDLRKGKNCGDTTLEEFRAALRKHNLHLRGES